jgi:hypothetical protein
VLRAAEARFLFLGGVVRIDSECLDISFQERFVIVLYHGPASSAPIT